MNTYLKREYDYAIRITAFLSGHYPDSYFTIKDISDLLFISKPFASRIINTLIQKGILGSIQGRNGGIYLKRDPVTISILDVLLAMEMDSTLNECVRDPGICPHVSYCKIHKYFQGLERMLIQSFASTNISQFAFTKEDLATDPDRLKLSLKPELRGQLDHA